MCTERLIDCHDAIVHIHFPQIHKVLGSGYISLDFHSLSCLAFFLFLFERPPPPCPPRQKDR